MKTPSNQAPTTIRQGAHIQVAGDFVRELPNGAVVVQVNGKEHAGDLVTAKGEKNNA